MLISLLLWIFESAVLVLYGQLIVRLLRPHFPHKDTPAQPTPILLLLIGLVVVTSLASLFSLFINLSWLTLLILTLGAFFIFYWEWRFDRLDSLKTYLRVPAGDKKWLLVALLILALVLDLSTRRPANPDTGIYHAQAIRWMETYPVVPGLGNLHSRLAYNSSWLVANALFSFSFTGIQSFHALPGLLMAWFALYSLEGIRRILKRAAQPSHWFRAVLLPLSFFTIAAESSSPGTDLPAILLLWFVFGEWLAQQEQPDIHPYRPMLLAFIAAFAVTVKLSIAPVILFSILIFFQYMRIKNFHLAGSIAIGIILIFIPWCARNVILSGYLVYPESSIDIFNVDWKIPAETVAAEKEIIQSWARIPREDAGLVQAMPFAAWSKTWYYNQSRSEQAFLWGIGLGPLSLAAGMLLSRKARRTLVPALRSYAWAYLVAYAGLIFWFFSAPDVRFGNGFILTALILGWLPWTLLFHSLMTKLALHIAWGMILTSLFFWGMLYRSIEPRTILERLIMPDKYTSLSTSPCEFKNVTILCADWYNECGYEAFPCVPAANPQVGLRGTHLEEGFRYFGP